MKIRYILWASLLAGVVALMLHQPAGAGATKKATEQAGFYDSDRHGWAVIPCEPKPVRMVVRTIPNPHHCPFAFDQLFRDRQSTGKKSATRLSGENYISFIASLNCHQPLLTQLRRRNI